MQVRLSTKDLEIMTKMKGSEKENLNNLVGNAELPAFNDKIKWKKHQDRRPCRRVTSSRENSPVRTSNEKKSAQEPAINGQKVNHISEKHNLSSRSSEEPCRKQQK